MKYAKFISNPNFVTFTAQEKSKPPPDLSLLGLFFKITECNPLSGTGMQCKEKGKSIDWHNKKVKALFLLWTHLL